MIKYTQAYIDRLNDLVNCDCCGKRMRLGQRISNVKGNVCADCVRSGRHKSLNERGNKCFRIYK